MLFFLLLSVLISCNVFKLVMSFQLSAVEILDRSPTESTWEPISHLTKPSTIAVTLGTSWSLLVHPLSAAAKMEPGTRPNQAAKVQSTPIQSNSQFPLQFDVEVQAESTEPVVTLQTVPWERLKDLLTLWSSWHPNIKSLSDVFDLVFDLSG